VNSALKDFIVTAKGGLVSEVSVICLFIEPFEISFFINPDCSVEINLDEIILTCRLSGKLLPLCNRENKDTNYYNSYL